MALELLFRFDAALPVRLVIDMPEICLLALDLRFPREVYVLVLWHRSSNVLDRIALQVTRSTKVERRNYVESSHIHTEEVPSI